MAKLPKYYGGKETEKELQKFWEKEGIYKYKPESDKPVFSIDTPPPTVSGKLHIGHVFSYTQAEIIARFYRMKGYNVFYPFGFDDNGLPTERLVEREKGVKPEDMDRKDFNNLCLEVSEEVENDFKNLWQSLGFSTDWSQLYLTIDESSQRISQRSFIDLYNKGYIYRKKSPALYCPKCHTTVAQAGTESKESPSKFVDIKFEIENGEELIISTTRPELLPALVAVFVHPEDKKYTNLIGKKIKPPLFDIEVEIKEDPKVDMEKGTGAVMCCTFGDTTDVEWFLEHKLELRQAIDEDGIMNEKAGKYSGLTIKEARKNIIEDLKRQDFIVGERKIQHPVNLHDRCGHEIEYIVKNQWFINIMDHKEELKKQGNKINWRPEFMKSRYANWVENLKWDWNISRQRYYGVPFPLWYCKECGEVILPEDTELPINPLKDKPSKKCNNCGSKNFVPEKDVMDTWATSSVTPQINGKWKEKDDRMDGIFPMNLRPQAHDIIRTWAFYTIVKSFYHHEDIPWKNTMISGHVLAKKGAKISKSKDNAPSTPQELIDQYSADPVRYWTAGARLGRDAEYSIEVIEDGRKLINKIWNAIKFSIMNLKGFEKGQKGPKNTIDKWILHRLSETIKTATDYLDKYEFGLALNVIEDFFWKDFCDNYIELSKQVFFRGEEKQKRGSQVVLYKVAFGILKLFSPYLPHLTEDLYQRFFKQFEEEKSIHITKWPEYNKNLINEEANYETSKILEFVELIRKAKSENNLSLRHPIEKIRFENDYKDVDLNKAMDQISFLLWINKVEEDFEPDYESESENGKIHLYIKWGEK